MRRRVKWYLITTTVFAVIIFAYYVVVLSPVFKIDVRVKGLKRLTKAEVLENVKTDLFKNTVARFLGIRNYFSWPDDFSLQNPKIAELNLDKSWLRKRIILSIKERDLEGIWCFEKSNPCFWFDQDGVLFKTAQNTEGYLITKITSDVKPRPPILGAKVVPNEWFSRIKTILNFFEREKIKTFNNKVLTSLHEFRTKTADGVEIRFSLRFDPESALAAVKTLKEKGELTNAVYVDLTVENRVYVKN